MLTSHEQTNDYLYFYESIQDLCVKMRINLRPDYICQDASNAMASAAETVFKNAKILMCYFHVKHNVFTKKKKNKKLNVLFFR